MCTHTDCCVGDGSGAVCVLCTNSAAIGSGVVVPFVCAVVGVCMAYVSARSRARETASDMARSMFPVLAREPSLPIRGNVWDPIRSQEPADDP